MAASAPAVRRIRYLAGIGPYQATPTTIHAVTREVDHPTRHVARIFSYEALIASNYSGRWEVQHEGNPSVFNPNTGRPSPTTTRHIRAARQALLED